MRILPTNWLFRYTPNSERRGGTLRALKSMIIKCFFELTRTTRPTNKGLEGKVVGVEVVSFVLFGEGVGWISTFGVSGVETGQVGGGTGGFDV